MERQVIGAISAVICIISIFVTAYCYKRYRRRLHVNRSVPSIVFIWSAIAAGSGYISYIALDGMGESNIIENIQGALTMLR